MIRRVLSAIAGALLRLGLWLDARTHSAPRAPRTALDIVTREASEERPGWLTDELLDMIASEAIRDEAMRLHYSRAWS